MDEKGLDDLLDTLDFIAMYKSRLPFNLRGWVNALGLYVQERKAGQWARLQAGGKLRSYLDAWQEEDGDWQVRKFDTDTWEHRFAHLVEATCEIAYFLDERVAYFGDLDIEGANALNRALQHYKDTGVWLGLPKVPEDVIRKKSEELARQFREREHQHRIANISRYEKMVQENAEDSFAWSMLASSYQQEERYKDMEHALKKCLESNARLGKLDFWDLRHLGSLYLAALSNSIRRKQIPITGYYFLSDVTVDSLGYTVEQTRNLAMQHFEKAVEISEKAISDGRHNHLTKHQKGAELAYNASKELSDKAFEEYDQYIEKEKQEEERQREESRRHVSDEDEET